MPIVDLNHYNLRVPAPELKRVVAFYENVLGFEYRPTDRVKWLYVNGRPLVHLTTIDAGGPEMPKQLIDHIAFTGADLSGMITQLRAGGTPFERRDYPELGVTQLVLTDPVGLSIELNFSAFPASE
jgi:catechol-2,3-dioxygenase